MMNNYHLGIKYNLFYSAVHGSSGL